jgi:hypothetical protein
MLRRAKHSKIEDVAPKEEEEEYLAQNLHHYTPHYAESS